MSLILLRPHNDSEIYRSIASLISFRFLAIPACRARLLRNHVGVLAHINFGPCEWDLAGRLFEQTLALDTPDATLSALKIRSGCKWTMDRIVMSAPLRLSQREFDELQADPPAEVDLRHRFTSFNFYELLMAVVKHQPQEVLSTIRDYCGIGRITVGAADSALIAPALAKNLMALRYADYAETRLQTDRIECLAYAETLPRAVLRELKALRTIDNNATYIKALHTAMNNFANTTFTRPCPELDGILNDDPFHAIHHMQPNSFAGDPKIVARALTHKFRDDGEPWRCPWVLRIVNKIFWHPFLYSNDKFSTIVNGAPQAWRVLRNLVNEHNPRFNTFDQVGITRCLWRFTLEHEGKLLISPNGVCIANGVLLTNHISSAETR